MRKHCFHLTRPHLATATAVVILVAACGRDTRGSNADTAVPDGLTASVSRVTTSHWWKRGNSRVVDFLTSP